MTGVGDAAVFTGYDGNCRVARRLVTKNNNLQICIWIVASMLSRMTYVPAQCIYLHSVLKEVMGEG